MPLNLTTAMRVEAQLVGHRDDLAGDRVVTAALAQRGGRTFVVGLFQADEIDVGGFVGNRGRFASLISLLLPFLFQNRSMIQRALQRQAVALGAARPPRAQVPARAVESIWCIWPS